MGKASRGKQDPDRRARIAAQRAAEKHRQQRNRILFAGTAIVAVIILAVVVVVFGVNHNGPASSSASKEPTGTALTTLTKQVTNIPASVLDQVGGGSIRKSDFIPGSKVASASASPGTYFATVNGPPLTKNGKPEFLYVGAEYCPFCAAERWAMINALSRFGAFSGLKASHSSSSDIDPNTPSWTFHGSTYASKYISFTPVEESTNERQGNSSDPTTPYVPLQNPTAAQQALLTKYDPGTGQGGAIPFIDLGNKYVGVGNMLPYGPETLKGKTWSQVAAAMSQPNSAIAQGAVGTANYLTAAICSLTKNQPATACTPAIQKLESDFAKS